MSAVPDDRSGNRSRRLQLDSSASDISSSPLSVMDQSSLPAPEVRAQLRALLTSLRPEEFNRILERYTSPRSAQHQTLKNILIEALKDPPTDLTIKTLDKYSEDHDCRPLAQVILMCRPEEVGAQLGLGVLVWACIHSEVKPPYEAIDFLFSRRIRINLINELNNAKKAKGHPVDVVDLLELHDKTLGPIPVQAEVISVRDRRVGESILNLILLCYQHYWQDTNTSLNQQMPVFGELHNRARHLPVSADISDLERLTKSGKDTSVLRNLVAFLPPKYIDEVFGTDARNLLMWTSINYSSSSVSRHFKPNVPRKERILNYLDQNYGIDKDDFEQAQFITWSLCNRSVDFDLVTANLKLLQHNLNFEPENFPIKDVMRRNALGGVTDTKARLYGVAALEVTRGRYEGADITWGRREWIETRGELSYIKTFAQNVRIDAPVGLAWLHELDVPKHVILANEGRLKLPIAMVSYYVHRAAHDGELEVLIAQMQGAQATVWDPNTEQFYTDPTPRGLWGNFRSVLAAMVVEHIKPLGLRWAIRRGEASQWLTEDEAINKFNKTVSNMTVDGRPLKRDPSGNFVWAK
jgi:hypothetical protein